MLQDKYFWLGFASLLINLIGYIPYIRGIFKDTVKPQRITWGIWAILTSVAFTNQVKNGGGYSTLFFGSTMFLVITVFLLSLKRGVGGKSKFDLFVLTASIVLFFLWAVTQDTRTTTVIAVAIDLFAALPTLYKSYIQPETEAYLQWILAAVAGLLSMLAVGVSTDYILFIYPLYIIIMNTLVVLAKFVGTKINSAKKLSVHQT
ncbi:hypothetical protein KA021_01105 [Candidatus Saccharibacteria bacterium]|jgi:hypothetical protein|nr:hypothetical protein [Candidatus Saccharibacteria bacterium]